LGSIRALSDGSGAVVRTADYDAYGQVVSTSGSTSTPFGYAGEYTDAESGFLYLRARYYDPATQQFLTVDPLLAATAQAYTYAGGSPLNFTDPAGLKHIDPLDGGGGGLIFPSGNGFHQNSFFEEFLDAFSSFTNVGQPFRGPFGAGGGSIGSSGSCAATEASVGLGKLLNRKIYVSQKGLSIVENHLATFGSVPENTAMVNRLRAALTKGEAITGADASFYLHEATEATLVSRGVEQTDAHLMAFAKYDVSPFSVYHPDVIKSFPELFNSNWFSFWGIQH
jgi:RHS repeat-associated protein